MNHHTPTPSTPIQTGGTWAKDRAAYLAAANECLKRIFQCRRLMHRWARIGHHVWAWEEHQAIRKHKERRSWYLEKTNAAPVQFNTEDAS